MEMKILLMLVWHGIETTWKSNQPTDMDVHFSGGWYDLVNGSIGFSLACWSHYNGEWNTMNTDIQINILVKDGLSDAQISMLLFKILKYIHKQPEVEDTMVDIDKESDIWT